MTDLPFMQLYVAEYLGDTRHLTTEQHGAYLLLLMAMWRADGRLPNDETKLARMAGLTAARWRKIGADVMAFFDVDGVSVTQKRLASEIEKAKEKSQKRSEAGKLGGEAKALKDKQRAVANAKPQPCHSSDIRYQNTSSLRSDDVRAREPDDDWPADFETRFWSRYPNKVGKPKALAALRMARKRRISFRTLMAGLDRYIREKPPDRAWCNPLTWLNQERWGDEPAAVSQRQQKSSGWDAACEAIIRESQGYPDEPQFDDHDPFRTANLARPGAGPHAAASAQRGGDRRAPLLDLAPIRTDDG